MFNESNTAGINLVVPNCFEDLTRKISQTKNASLRSKYFYLHPFMKMGIFNMADK